MEMTIEESLEWLISRKEHYEMDDNCQELAKALDLAIATMYKYQKIQEIVTNSELEWGNTSVRANALLDVKKVVEDGNDTTNTGSN